MLSKPAAAGKRDLRKELGARDADLRIGGNQILFRLLDIGAALQKL